MKLLTPAAKIFEEKKLMPHKVKPIINETILNLNDAIQCDTDQNKLTSQLVSFKVGDGSTITIKCFNAAYAPS